MIFENLQPLTRQQEAMFSKFSIFTLCSEEKVFFIAFIGDAHQMQFVSREKLQ
jgi:hypothetical protein